MTDYQPETYWSEVAQRTTERCDNLLIAGDDEPFYVYKRDMFLKLLDKIDVRGRSVLEVGSGPGGNLLFVSQKQPSRLCGADISQAMIDIARTQVHEDVIIKKSDGSSLPYNENEFDIVFCATVLQHVTDPQMVDNLIEAMCHVSNDRIYIFERVEKHLKGDELNQGRPIEWYTKRFKSHGFQSLSNEFIHINVSYYVCGAIRKLLNSPNREEGEPLNRLSIVLENLLLPITKQLDKIFRAERDLACISFTKSQ